MRQVLVVLFVGLGLFGCVVPVPDPMLKGVNPELYYFKTSEAVTNAKRASDSLNCTVIASNAVPASLQITTKPGYTAPVSCYNGSCYGGAGVGSTTSSVDTNYALRHRFIKKCMADKGYSSNKAKIYGCRAEQVPTGYHNSETLIYEPKPNSCLVQGPLGHMDNDNISVLRAEDQLVPN